MNEGLQKQFLGRAAALLPLMAERAITDILINGTHSLYVERAGVLEAEPNPFPDASSLFDFVERCLIPTGKRIDAAHPYLDGSLADGSRFHVILPPIAVRGPCLSIRKFREFGDEVSLESFGAAACTQWLRKQVAERRNLLIAGSTGAGKTTLLSRLLALVPDHERIAILEESREIRCPHPHLVFLEARPPSPDGTGEVTLQALLKNALRMRPDRIVLGECRGREAFDMLQAMNCGHLGSLGTIHANGAMDALRRLEALALLAGFAVPLRTLREWIGAAIHGVVHVRRTENGAREIAEILQVHGLEGEAYRITPIYREGEWR